MFTNKVLLLRNKLLLKIFFFWIMISVSVAGWLLINIYVVRTSSLIDGLFGLALIFVVLKFFPNIYILFPKSKSLLLFGWIYLFYCLIASILYFSSFEVRFILAAPLFWGNRLVILIGQNPDYYRLLELLVFSLFLGFLMVLLPIAYQFSLKTYFEKISDLIIERLTDFYETLLSNWLKDLRLGPAKLLSRRIVLMCLVIFILTLISTSLSNFYSPKLNLRNIAGPIPSAQVYSINIDDKNNYLYTGTSNGLYRSVDNGSSWVNVSLELSYQTIRAIAIDRSYNMLYVGTANSGIFRSKDGGENWERYNEGLSDYHVTSLIIDESRKTIYAGTHDGVFRRAANESHWENPSQKDQNGLIVASLVLNRKKNILYAGTEGYGIFQSNDGGVTWVQSMTGIPNYYIYAMAHNEASDILYAGTWGKGIFLSIDGGKTWKENNAGLRNAYVWSLYVDPASDTVFAGTDAGLFLAKKGDDEWQEVDYGMGSIVTYAINVDQMNGFLYAGTWGGIFRSADNGNTWQGNRVGQSLPEISSLLFNSFDGAFYLATQRGGVFRSNDGGETWIGTNLGLPSYEIRTLSINKRNNALYTGTETGIYRSLNGGQSWERFFQTSLGFGIQYLSIKNDGSIYAINDIGALLNFSKGSDDPKILSILEFKRGSSLIINEKRNQLYLLKPSRGVFSPGGEEKKQMWNNEVLVSHDGGYTWDDMSRNFPNTDINTFIFLDSKNKLYAGGVDGLFESSDYGQSWQQYKIDSEQNIVYSLFFEEVENKVYADTLNGLYRSTDEGLTWQRLGNNFTGKIKHLIRNVKTGSLVAGTSNGVVQSIDDGTTWVVSSSGITNNPVRSILFNVEDRKIFAGTEGNGVFISSDMGSSWKLASSGLVNTDVNSLVLARSNNTVIAGTGRGVFRFNDDSMRWVGTDNVLEGKFIRSFYIDKRRNIVYAIAKESIFLSVDEGITWQRADYGLPINFIETLLIDEETGFLYVNTRYGVFRSENMGKTWSDVNDGLNGYVQSVILGEKSKQLYALTRSGRGSTDQTYLYRSIDGGQIWEEITILSDKNVDMLLLDKNRNILYAYSPNRYPGTMLKSEDKGRNWQTADNGLPESINSLFIDEKTGVLFASDWENFYRSEDYGETWRTVIAGQEIQDFVIDKQRGVFYAASSRGDLFTSEEPGLKWERISHNLKDESSGLYVSLFFNEKNGFLYFYDWRKGIFKSEDRGRSWEKANNGLTSNVITSMITTKNGSLLGGTYIGGVVISKDDGHSWEKTSNGLMNIDIQNLVIDQKNDILFTTVWGLGIFRSEDGGQSWEGSSTGLEDLLVRFLWIDDLNKKIYARTANGLYISNNGGYNWEGTQSDFKIAITSFLNLTKTKGLVFRQENTGTLIWAVEEGNPFWDQFANRYGLILVKIHNNPENHRYLVGNLGSSLLVSEFPSTISIETGIWLALKAVISYILLPWLRSNFPYILLSICVMFFLRVFRFYNNIVRPYQMPLKSVLFAGRNISTCVNQLKLNESWQLWKIIIQSQLLEFGEVKSYDLLKVPSIFQQYAINRYYNEYKDQQVLELGTDSIRIKELERLKKWQKNWREACDSVGENSGMNGKSRQAVTNLVNLISTVLEFNVIDSRDFSTLRIYLVEALSLRLNLPKRFPIIFLADPSPSDTTVQALVNSVDVLKEQGYFALVVPLTSKQNSDISGQLRKSISCSPYAQDFIVLSKWDISLMIVSRFPQKALVKPISSQRNLIMLSPFVVNGPVPEGMFFGREMEIRTLVDTSSKLDFSVIGNRKIGKTSLLNSVTRRLRGSESILPLRIDCQPLQNLDDFLVSFSHTAEINTPIKSLLDFSNAVKQLGFTKRVMPVFLLDEVDLLLNKDKIEGEQLTSTWRSLGQANVCHFVFFGSGGLARLLSNPTSAFFNFTQSISLGYLSESETKLLISQPIETLGVGIEDEEELHRQIFEMSSGHPNLVQYLGRELVILANRRDEKRILLSDLRAIRESSNYRFFYFDTLWGAVEPLEKLITLVAPQGEFRVVEIEQSLAHHEVFISEEDLDKALRMLIVYSLLEQQGIFYHLVPGAFFDTLHSTQEVDRLIQIEKRKYFSERLK